MSIYELLVIPVQALNRLKSIIRSKRKTALKDEKRKVKCPPKLMAEMKEMLK